MTTVKPPRCGFCGKPSQDVRILIEGDHGGFICYRCVERAVAHVDRERTKRREARMQDMAK